MSLASSPSSGRGELTLQPAYFTSSTFVHAARADVDRLVEEYARRYAPSAPFVLFKEIWQELGWPWLQFTVYDSRSRAAFLRVMMRLFLERIAGGPPLCRVAALFGLYTTYHTQPSTSAPSLYSARRAEVAYDVYRELLALPDALDGEHLHPVRAHVIYVQSNLLQAQVFHILPHTETHPQSPRALPREVVGDEDGSTGNRRKRRGRPCKRDRLQQARASVAALENGWEGGSAAGVTRGRYVEARSALFTALGRDVRWEGALRDASGAVVERMGVISDR